MKTMVKVVKVAEYSFGSLSICHLPNLGEKKLAAQKLKRGK